MSNEKESFSDQPGKWTIILLNQLLQFASVILSREVWLKDIKTRYKLIWFSCSVLATISTNNVTAGYESDVENSSPPSDPAVVLDASSRGRRRRDRTHFTAAGLTSLEEHFHGDRYPDIHARERLAEQLGVSEDRIQVRATPWVKEGSYG